MEPPALSAAVSRNGRVYFMRPREGEEVPVTILGSEEPQGLAPFLRTHHTITGAKSVARCGVGPTAIRGHQECVFCRAGVRRSRMIAVREVGGASYFELSGRALRAFEEREMDRGAVRHELTREEVTKIGREASAHLEDVRRRLR